MRTYHFLAETTSTNDVAKTLASQTDSPNAVIVAERQLKGRGSNELVWISDSKEGLYYSYLTCPTQTPEDIQSLLTIVAHRVVEVIEQLTGLRAEVEWPNDIILNQKKVGGILIETAVGTLPPKMKYVIIGIGLNINQTTFPESLKHSAISLWQVGQVHYPKYPFIHELTQELDNVFSRH